MYLNLLKWTSHRLTFCSLSISFSDFKNKLPDRLYTQSNIDIILLSFLTIIPIKVKDRLVTNISRSIISSVDNTTNEARGFQVLPPLTKEYEKYIKVYSCHASQETENQLLK